MRVVILSKSLAVGAYQRKAEWIAAQADVELTVLVPHQWQGRPAERAYVQGYDLHTLPIRLDGHFHLHYYPTLSRALRALQPDILHIDEEPYNLATWHAARCALHLPQRPRLVFFSWQNLLKTYPPPFRWLEQAVLHAVDAAIVGNQEAHHVWRAKGFRRPMRVIPQFGVDESHFQPLPRPPSDTFTIGYAGRLVHEKGVDILLRAFARLPTQARLIVLGAGDQLTALRALAQQLGIAERVAFRPPLSSTDMPTFYQQLDAFVLPSRSTPRWKEQFGRVLIEAMACGVPVVTSRCGEAPHVVGDAGMVFEEEDAESLAHHLAQLLDNTQLRQHLARAGRQRVLVHFTMRHIADETVNFYRALM
ncbi:MAG: glycosyltransferase [Thermoflexales bacterium]